MKINKSVQHSKMLLSIFSVSNAFQNFDVHFWTILKTEKVRTRSSFWQEIFSSKLYFYYLFEKNKLLFHWISEKNCHCYTSLVSAHPWHDPAARTSSAVFTADGVTKIKASADRS